jgi:hypothetical protein
MIEVFGTKHHDLNFDLIFENAKELTDKYESLSAQKIAESYDQLDAQ